MVHTHYIRKKMFVSIIIYNIYCSKYIGEQLLWFYYVNKQYNV